MDEQIEFPINGILDLHTFNPHDVKDLVPEYIHTCRENGIYQIRVIHGKGKGVLRQTVHSILEKLPDVEHFWQEGAAGSWGATIVKLKR
jgi:DNA-nicking Smr family endonuclease